MSDEELVEYFRKFYPQTYAHEFVKDYPRHTSISAFVQISLGEIDRAATHYGNSRKVITKNYRGRMSLAAGIVHYRLLPTGLKGKYKAEDVALPNWCQADPDELSEADRKEMLALFASLPSFDPTVHYVDRAPLALDKQSRSDGQQRRWANAKAADHWAEQRAKMAKRAELARARRGGMRGRQSASELASGPGVVELPLQAA